MTEDDFDFGGIEIADPETFSYGSKDNTFNHSVLVMRAYQKAQDALSKEKIEGFWDTKRDNLGNIFNIYHPDTRREAIETVKTLKNCMMADIQDTEYEEEINKLLEEINELYKTYLEMQKEWWESLRVQERESNKLFKPYISAEKLYEKGTFYQDYLYAVVEVYRKIFEQLELCLANHKRYYKRSKVTA